MTAAALALAAVLAVAAWWRLQRPDVGWSPPSPRAAAAARLAESVARLTESMRPGLERLAACGITAEVAGERFRAFARAITAAAQADTVGHHRRAAIFGIYGPAVRAAADYERSVATLAATIERGRVVLPDDDTDWGDPDHRAAIAAARAWIARNRPAAG